MEQDKPRSISRTIDEHRVMIVTLDAPGKPVNTLTPEVLADLAEVVLAIEHDKPTGVIFTSAKAHNFCAGADLFAVKALPVDAADRFVGDGQELFERIAQLSVPTVAAINGDALGGGYELSLACRYRVAADDASISIGLPEVKIGLIPAWGGTTRLPRLIGLTKALPILLAGKTMPPRKAKKAGLVDDVVRPEALIAAAHRWLVSAPRRHHSSMLERGAMAISAVRRRILDTAEHRVLEQTHGHYPAPRELIGVVRGTYGRSVAEGLTAERQAIGRLMQSAECRELIRLFSLRQSSKKNVVANLSAKPSEVKYAAVVGGGVMGSGIVYSLARAGMQVRLIEVDAKAASAGLSRVKKVIDDDLAAGRMNKLDARRVMDRISPAVDFTGLKLADLVIEAVVEKMDVKRDVFAKLSRLTRPQTVLASNTSSLSIGEMAAVVDDPGRVLGLHFFNPVQKMPLVEIVRTPHTNDAAMATAVALASKLGKTLVVSNDAPGFIVNRVLIPYLSEAMTVAIEGTPITTIDRAMKDWGMPMGAFELLDEIGLDIALHVLKYLSGQLGERFDVPKGLENAVANGWLGKKSGKGFFKPGAKKHESVPNTELLRVMGVPEHPAAPPLDEDTVQWRLTLPMVNEAARLLEEGVCDSAETIDLASVMGLGLAPFRGGLMKFADTVGAEELVKRMDDFTAKYGPRFTPPQLLRQWAQEHRRVEEMRPAVPLKQWQPAAFRTATPDHATA